MQPAPQVIGASVDSQFSHHAWRNTARDQGGTGQIQYPIVADLTKWIGGDYDALTGDGAVTYRGLFLIDKAGMVRHQIVNDLPLGRNVDEALRMVDALDFHEANGEVCPANWNKGKPGMQATAEASRPTSQKTPRSFELVFGTGASSSFHGFSSTRVPSSRMRSVRKDTFVHGMRSPLNMGTLVTRSTLT